MSTATAPPPSNAVAKPNGQHHQPVNGIRAWLGGDALKQQLAQVLPKHLSPERQARVAMTALTRTPKLAECDPASFFQCLLSLSQFGLEPDGRLAHLIPFENRKRGVTECQLIIDYKGLVELAMRSGKVANIHADVVCEHDEFEYDRGEIKKHRIDFRKPRGAVFAAYALVRFKDGTEKCDVMSREDIEAIRKRSRAGNSGPWVTDWNAMAVKTVFRRLSKWISLSAEYRDAVDVDDDTIDTRMLPADAMLLTKGIVEYRAATKSDELAALLEKPADDSPASGEESQEQPDGALNDAVPYWLSIIGEARDQPALIRKHEQFQGIRADLTSDQQEQIEQAFAKRLGEFPATK